MVAEGTSSELKERVGGQRLHLTLAGARAYEAVAALLGGQAIHRDSGRLTLGVATDGSAAHARALLDAVDPERTAVASFAIHSATLDDVFLALTGHAAAPGTDPMIEKEIARV